MRLNVGEARGWFWVEAQGFNGRSVAVEEEEGSRLWGLRVQVLAS